MLVNVTMALGTTDALGSFTLPTTDPWVAWAWTCMQPRANASNMPHTANTCCNLRCPIECLCSHIVITSSKWCLDGTSFRFETLLEWGKSAYGAPGSGSAALGNSCYPQE